MMEIEVWIIMPMTRCSTIISRIQQFTPIQKKIQNVFLISIPSLIASTFHVWKPFFATFSSFFTCWIVEAN